MSPCQRDSKKSNRKQESTKLTVASRFFRRPSHLQATPGPLDSLDCWPARVSSSNRPSSSSGTARVIRIGLDTSRRIGRSKICIRLWLCESTLPTSLLSYSSYLKRLESQTFPSLWFVRRSASKDPSTEKVATRTSKPTTRSRE